MKEFAFIRNNIDKWQRAEIIIDDAASQTPDVLADTYTDLTSDLADKVAKFLKVQPKENSKEKFLATILYDYNYYLMELI